MEVPKKKARPLAGQQARALARLQLEQQKTAAEQIRLAKEKEELNEARRSAVAAKERLKIIKEWKEDKRKRVEEIRESELAEIAAVQKTIEDARREIEEKERIQKEREAAVRKAEQEKEAIARERRLSIAKEVLHRRAKERDLATALRLSAAEREHRARIRKAGGVDPDKDDYLTIYGGVFITLLLLGYVFRCLRIQTLTAHARVSLQNCLQFLTDTGILDKLKVGMFYAFCGACSLLSKIPCPSLSFLNRPPSVQLNRESHVDLDRESITDLSRESNREPTLDLGKDTTDDDQSLCNDSDSPTCSSLADFLGSDSSAIPQNVTFEPRDLLIKPSVTRKMTNVDLDTSKPPTATAPITSIMSDMSNVPTETKLSDSKLNPDTSKDIEEKGL